MLDMTAYAAMLKEYYIPDAIENRIYRDNPFLALVPKDENATGKYIDIPVIYNNNQGRSATLSTAQTIVGTSSSGSYTGTKAFNLTRVSDYGVARVGLETVLASKDDKGAFLRAATTEIDSTLKAVSRSLAIAMYRGGWGSLGTVASYSTGSTSTIILTNADDITNFDYGQYLEVGATETGALRASAGVAVSGIDRVNGKLYMGSALTTWSSFTAGDTLFAQGDHTSNTMTKIAGLEAWAPRSEPGSTSFFGVDRSVDTSRLGGLRYDASALSIDEGLVKAAHLMGREGAKADHCFISFSKFGDLCNILGEKARYVELKKGSIGFAAIELLTPAGVVKVIPDVNCPVNRAFMVQLDLLKLYSLGKAPRILEYPGAGETIIQASADGIEVRCGYYANLGCKYPGGVMNILV